MGEVPDPHLGPSQRGDMLMEAPPPRRYGKRLRGLKRLGLFTGGLSMSRWPPVDGGLHSFRGHAVHRWWCGQERVWP